MARTKGKPGPKPKYGDREEIHVLVPVDDLNYIRSVTSNVTEWVIKAIQEKRASEELFSAGRDAEEFLSQSAQERAKKLMEKHGIEFNYHPGMADLMSEEVSRKDR
jgi:hypothetical protein